jgi:hypothetical protein
MIGYSFNLWNAFFQAKTADARAALRRARILCEFCAENREHGRVPCFYPIPFQEERLKAF